MGMGASILGYANYVVSSKKAIDREIKLEEYDLAKKFLKYTNLLIKQNLQRWWRNYVLAGLNKNCSFLWLSWLARLVSYD